MTAWYFALLCAILAGAFIVVEHKENYIPAVILKGSASLCFVLFGYFGSQLLACGDYGKLMLVGLILGCVADVLLNLRFVLTKIGTPVFLVGILVFLSGHVVYLSAVIPQSSHLVVTIPLGAVLTAITMVLIFRVITAKPAFKIFGVFYIGAIMILTCVAAGNLFASPTAETVLFFLGTLSFLISDIVLILNTFTGKTTFALRITNLSLYYLGQLLIAYSLQWHCFIS